MINDASILQNVILKCKLTANSNRKGRWIGHRFSWSHLEEYPMLKKSDYLECSVCGENYYRMIYDFSGHLHYCRPHYDKSDLTPAYCPS